MGASSPLLVVDELVTEFRGEHGLVRAVDGASFEIAPGQTLGVVGESGCGKSVTALSIMRLVQDPPGRVASGRIAFQGKDLRTLPEDELRRLRGNRLAMIFQEPMTSLNPVLTIGEQIAEVFRTHKRESRAVAMAHAIQALGEVGIPAPAERIRAYPYQLSGGMRQRVMIAMALACNPALLIADEPTTALDVTIQAQILDLLARMQKQHGMAIMLITHDLGVVAETCADVVVMYAGKVVERGATARVLARPLHHYTAGLLRSRVPDEPAPATADGKRPRLPVIADRQAPLPRPQPGCKFSDRCPAAVDRCWDDAPELRELEPGHAVRCHFPLGLAS